MIFIFANICTCLRLQMQMEDEHKSIITSNNLHLKNAFNGKLFLSTSERCNHIKMDALPLKEVLRTVTKSLAEELCG